MARKSIGHIKLVWTCPNCGTRNPGPQKTCSGCGSPQPEQVAFEKPQQDVLITDQKEIESAKGAPDIHCPFCGTRNAATQKICTQCGGDLTGGSVRPTGQVVGAFQTGAATIKCPSCSTINPSTAVKCSKCGSTLQELKPEKPAPQIETPISGITKRKINPLVIILPVVALLITCIILITLISRTNEKTAEVVDLSWTRSISIESYELKNYSGWKDEIPADATINSCEMAYHHTSDAPEPSSTEVCGTPYVVDDGSGYGEVVEDCTYEVYRERCSFSLNEWYVTESITIGGNNASPQWPEITLTENQREGIRNENFVISFNDGNEIFNYSTTDLDYFLQFEPGSVWKITVDGFNNISEILPVN